MYEVNVMNWIKKYGGYILIIFIIIFGGAIERNAFRNFGDAFYMFIKHIKNWGTVADWVSGVGSLFAIAFAYWQIREQRKQISEQIREYEIDKKREKELEKLHNRPFFSLEKKTNLTHGLNIVWTDIEYAAEICDSFEEIDENDGRLWYYSVKKQGYMYDFKNISANSAINLSLAISYIDSSLEETINNKDVITLYRGVIQNESITFMAPTMIRDNEKAMWKSDKKISLYFASVDGEWYRQDWLDERSKKIKNDFVSSKIEYQGIERIDATEVPKGNNAGYYSHVIKN